MKSLKNLQPVNWDIELNKIQYDAEINRKNPSAFIFMIDQSGSMSTKSFYKGEYKSLAEIVSDMINELLDELIGRCTKTEGVRNYFDVCVLGYGKNSYTSEVLWEGNLKGKDWVNISDLKKNANYEKRMVVTTIRGKTKTEEKDVPYWFKPVSQSLTPMGHAFDKAHELLSNWIKDKRHENSYPPVVINITDGAQTDCNNDELIQKAQKVQALNTKDGHVLVLNCHLSNSANTTIKFPLSIDELTNAYSKRLFKMSSVMPETFNQGIFKIRGDRDIFNNYRGMVFNANMDDLFNFIDIGTSGATQQLTSK